MLFRNPHILHIFQIFMINPTGQDEGGVFFSKPSKRRFWEGSGKKYYSWKYSWNKKYKFRTICRQFWTFEVFWSEILYQPIINQGKNCTLSLEISPKRIFKKTWSILKNCRFQKVLEMDFLSKIINLCFDLYQLMTKVWILRERKCMKYFIFDIF